MRSEGSCRRAATMAPQRVWLMTAVGPPPCAMTMDDIEPPLLRRVSEAFCDLTALARIARTRFRLTPSAPVDAGHRSGDWRRLQPSQAVSPQRIASFD